MTDTVKLALVGCGWISEAHVNAYRDLFERGCREFEVVACCDPIAEKARNRADAIAAFQGKAPVCLADIDALIASGTAEAADICLPHCFHHSVAIPVLEAGMHVLLEKPLGITIKASRKIIGAAEKRNLVLATAENTRRTLGSRACRWAISEAKMLGNMRAAHVIWISRCPFDPADPAFKWRCVRLLTGGGMILDSGAHFADMMVHMFGDPDEVFCTMATHERQWIEDAPRVGSVWSDAEDTWNAVIRFRSGVEVVWSYSRVFHGDRITHGHYYGDGGTMKDEGFPIHCFENGGTLTRTDGSTMSMQALQQEYTASLSEDGKDRIFPYGATNGFSVEIADFLRAVRTRSAPEVDGTTGMRAKALCETCYESATAGVPVKYADVLSGAVSAYQDPINAFWAI